MDIPHVVDLQGVSVQLHGGGAKDHFTQQLAVSGLIMEGTKRKGEEGGGGEGEERRRRGEEGRGGGGERREGGGGEEGRLIDMCTHVHAHIIM